MHQIGTNNKGEKAVSVLYQPTLVLNKGWQAHNAITVRDALVNVIAERARIVCPKSYPDPAYHYQLFNIEAWIKLDPGDKFVNAGRCHIRIPEVIIFDEFDKLPVRELVFSRKNLWKRDGFFCQYCGKQPPRDEITMDHIDPKRDGGISSFKNCVLACFKCNVKKGGRTPEVAGMPLIHWVSKNGKPCLEKYHRPKTPQWSPLYNLSRVGKFPESWKDFLQNKNDELYWNVELEP